jgi:DNA-binding IclR family transcriptional regulator
MKQMSPKNSIYKVQALERALNILDCFSFQNRELSLSEVVKITGLNKTTAKRLISNLESRGYLQQDPQTKAYQLGMRLFELGGIVFSSISLRRAAARRPLHYGMLGMVLMASLDSKEVREILKKHPLESHTPFSITDQDAFSLRLEQIRDQGYVMEKEEAVEGAMGIAAPIRDYSRQVTAALGIALPLGQRNLDKDVDRIVDLVKKTCETISSDLGYLKI